MTLFFQTLPVKQLLFLLAAAMAAAGYARWEFDPAYVTTEVFQQVYLTDEGLYMKPVTALLRTGTVNTPHDVNAAAHTTPVHVWLTALAMKIAGMHWTVARWVSIFMASVGLVSFWSICRARMPAPVAWLAAIAVATNFLYFHAARMATADPTGLGLCALAVWIWISWRHTAPGLAAALAIGIAAAWAKQTYAPVLVGMGVAELVTAWGEWRSGDRKMPLQRLAVLSLAAAAHAYFLHLQFAAIANTVPYTHPFAGGFSVSLGTGIRQLFHSLLVAMPILPGTTAMVAAAVIGFFLQAPARRRECIADPLVQLCAVWILANTIMVGLISLSPARYYFATIFAWTFPAFRFLAWDGQAYRARWAALLMTANLCVQIPFFHLWLTQQPEQTYIAVSRDVARRITEANPGGAQLLGHGLPDWIELFDSRIIGRDVGYRPIDAISPLERRLDALRPEYLLVNEDDIWTSPVAIEDLRRKSASFWAGMDLVAEYKLLFRYIFPNSPVHGPNLKLYRMRYHGRTGLAPAEKETGKPPIYSK